MNIKEMNKWKDLILKAPKVEIVDDGWTLHVGGWQSRATIPLTQIDGVQGHCAAFWRKYPEEDEFVVKKAIRQYCRPIITYNF